jgi:hypothetical protein
MMFQVFRLSFFLYVARIASGCFKNRSGVVHGMRVGSERGSESSPRMDASDAGMVERRPAQAHAWSREREGETDCSRGCLFGRHHCFHMDKSLLPTSEGHKSLKYGGGF